VGKGTLRGARERGEKGEGHCERGREGGRELTEFGSVEILLGEGRGAGNRERGSSKERSESRGGVVCRGKVTEESRVGG